MGVISDVADRQHGRDQFQPELSPALAALVAQIWATSDDYSPVRIGSAQYLSGMRPFRRYQALPGLLRARVLVPADGLAAGASLSRFNSLRRRPTRLARAVLGVGLRSGLPQRVLRRQQLTVHVDTALPDGALADWLPEAWLAESLGVPELRMAVGVRALLPNQKPVLQLFDAAGTPRGYGKVGWNPVAAERVRREMLALRSPRTRALTAVTVPALLHHGSWRDRDVLVVAPMPERARRYAGQQPPPLGTSMEIAAAEGLRRAELKTSPHWQCTLRQLDVLRADAAHAELGAQLGRLADDLEGRVGTEEVTFGSWHGDWVPWNMAHGVDDRLWVWDWEHSSADVPVGFDLLHWHFQCAFIRDGAGLPAAIARTMTDGVDAVQELLGATAAVASDVARLYLLEIALRNYDLHRSGAGWRRDYYPAVLSAYGGLNP